MRRPPDGMDMRGSLRGSGGRGGVITQEELKRRIEHQQKQNEINMGQQQLIGSQQSQLMAMNQNQNLLKAKIYEQNHLRQGSTVKNRKKSRKSKLIGWNNFEIYETHLKDFESQNHLHHFNQ